ncbi:MAG: hypothetical protein ACI4J4_05875 [Ruminiclostridium sp.]
MRGRLALKILAAVSMGMIGFPLMFCCDINSFGSIEPFRLLICHGVFLLCAFLGFVGGEVTKKRPKLRLLARLFGILTFGAGFIYLPMGGDYFAVFAAGLNSVFWYFIGERFGRVNFADMFPFFLMGFYIVLAVFCYLYAAFAAEEAIRETAKKVILGALALQFCSAALLINQSGIYDRAERRKDVRAALPAGLSVYNGALIIGITALGFLLLFFADELAWCLEKIALFLIWLFITIANLFEAEKMSVEPSEAQTGLTGFSESGSNPLWQAVAVIFAVILLIVFRKKIIAGIKGFFSRIVSFLSKKGESSQEADFTDVFEDYRKMPEKREEKVSLNKLYKQYRNEKDPEKKYRCGYRILLYKIKEKNSRLTTADTTSVQAEKGGEAGFSGLFAVAADYDGLRYGDKNITENQLSKLTELIGKE